jgi:type II secretory pathway predicted ATPase ExeA
MDLYLYHLRSNPFVSPSANTLFWSAMHQAVWDGLIQRLEARAGIIVLLGQPGLGKSTWLRTYRSLADPKYVDVIDHIDTGQSQDDLLTSLAQACGLTSAETHPETLFNRLYEHCQSVHSHGRQMVLLIDDAHTWSMSALEHLHELFKRLHRASEPLLQIVLCGSPTLQQHCQHPNLSRFEAALATALTLLPLAVEERAAYIHHYLRSASLRSTRIFTNKALKLIANHSQGIPKVINITCSDVLVAGHLAGERPISAATVRSVLGDHTSRVPSIVCWGLVSTACLLLAAGLWHLLPTTARQSTQVATVEPEAPNRPAVATPVEVENTIRQFREQHNLNHIASKTTDIGRDDMDTTQDQMNAVNPSPKMAAAFETQPPLSPPAHPALIASTEAHLLCAVPRTDGSRGSDIVLLGYAPHSVHRLIDDGSQNMSPALSPDGTHLAYTSYRGGAPQIYLRNLASGQETQLTTGPWLALPGTWSPNGRYLAFSQSVRGNTDIFIYDMTQRRSRRLTQHEGIDVSPSFAPDSQRLVFSSDRTGAPQLYITDIASSPSPVRLTQTGAYNTAPSWSPQDDIIAFVGRSGNKALDLYTIKPDGSQRRRLTQDQRFHTPPAWLPDGHTLMGMNLHGALWEQHLVQLQPDRAIPTLPQPESICLAPQWVAYRAP